MLKNALKISMMQYNVAKDGDRFIISSKMWSTILNLENGHLLLTLSLLLLKPLFKDVQS